MCATDEAEKSMTDNADQLPTTALQVNNSAEHQPAAGKKQVKKQPAQQGARSEHKEYRPGREAGAIKGGPSKARATTGPNQQ